MRTSLRLIVWGLWALAITVSVGSPPARAASPQICVIDSFGSGSPGCGTGFSFAIGLNGEGGARANRNLRAVTPIDKHGICRYIDNLTTNTDFFVPFNSTGEWSSFRNVVETSGKSMHGKISFAHCGRAACTTVSYGTTDKRDGDGGDLSRNRTVCFPYARTGTQWGGPSESITNTCREDYSVSVCRRECPVYRTDCTPAHCDPMPFPPYFWCFPEECHQVQTGTECCDWGSECRSREHSWTSTFSMLATALDADQYPSPQMSWTWSISRGGQSRPSACDTRCSMDASGHSCSCGGSSSPPSGCSVPSLISYNACAVYVCTNTPSWGNCLYVALLTINSNNTVNSLLAAGDSCGAAAERNAMNAGISSLNAACSATFGF